MICKFKVLSWARQSLEALKAEIEGSLLFI